MIAFSPATTAQAFRGASVERAAFQYRIKNADEPHERVANKRVAKESELGGAA
jgi:hypothetical protein